ncbi:Tll0287-like domain-containing protein [Pelotalea chapellei]|uniref:DUF3365 domain-containing protein n=1 Tax=Pelotalea chapellei TaxID=44671 RepID=A0ABS5U3V3_9BACT|nr:DUF3365 domain-containing protein [Pelotalea chapellei]MBT1070346.1 DUF3365 domain-containing protein [Pelotalea chapellei]
MRNSSLLAITVTLLVTSVASGAAEDNSKQPVAAKAIGQLGHEMRKKLTESLHKNGPAGAIDVCAKDAPAISNRIENELGVTIKRTSLQVRNPQNSPDAAELQLLGVLAAAHSAGEKLPQGVTVFPHNTRRFYKVIMMEQTCLKCHGDSTTMSEVVRKELATLYPEDKAVGYKEGDFRGIISATVK